MYICIFIAIVGLKMDLLFGSSGLWVLGEPDIPGRHGASSGGSLAGPGRAGTGRRPWSEAAPRW